MSDRLLAYYCNVTGHEPVCPDWHEHRDRVNLHLAVLQAQLDTIPDSLAVGRTVQQAKETGQTSVTGYSWKGVTEQVRTTVSYSPDDIHEVHWFLSKSERGGWWTKDTIISEANRFQYHIEDVRAVTAVAYKGICRAHVFVDGVADVWNEWK